jgi:HEAT repeat protein
MLSTDARDAAFIDFFTGDEHRFKVLVKNFDDDSHLARVYFTGPIVSLISK